MSLELAKFIPWLPALAAVLCGLCCLKRSLRGLAAVICIAGIAGAFLLTLGVAGQIAPFKHDVKKGQHVVTAFHWLNFGTPTTGGGTGVPPVADSVDSGTGVPPVNAAHPGPTQLIAGPSDHAPDTEPATPTFRADMSYFLDPLTLVMLIVVTGVGTLVAIYAAGYMKGDPGYARFFAFVALFIFAMTSLVMADNLVLLYLGWEGVGLCSYLLIGYYYQKPSAVAAAKKAFIVNRIGDLGFALGIFWIWTSYGTVSLEEVIRMALHGGPRDGGSDLANTWIPFLLMLGAFGKSAQIPLYVWLPDAMEGPTPVSALIHAATMVTAGVYMIARLLPVFELSPAALPAVAVVGGVTALFAGTIALCQYDIKRIFAYSTISQLGYMFLGVGALSSVGGVFHLFTHAFFKALLFLTAGSVMHALAGQLDLRKMSGLRGKMPVTAVLMLIGCLALAGFPFTAGFYSKDTILAAAMERGLGQGPYHLLFLLLAGVGLLTALITAFYTFRLWFRVFLGPTEYEMGHEHHGEDAGNHAPAPPARSAPAIRVEHHHEPHEVSWLMNGPLVVLAAGALLAGVLGHGFLESCLGNSTAAVHAHADHHVSLLHLGLSLHTEMMILSSLIALAGIGLAAHYHWLRRDAADRVAAAWPGVVRTLANKYYVDEVYDTVLVRPLRTLGQVFWAFDALVIDGLVALVGFLPRVLGLALQPAQRGLLQGYGLGMAAGAAVAMLLLYWML